MILKSNIFTIDLIFGLLITVIIFLLHKPIIKIPSKVLVFCLVASITTITVLEFIAYH